MEWILILLVHVGAFGKTDSVALASVAGFASKQECDAAGLQAKGLVAGTIKSSSHVCVQRAKAQP